MACFRHALLTTLVAIGLVGAAPATKADPDRDVLVHGTVTGRDGRPASGVSLYLAGRGERLDGSASGLAERRRVFVTGADGRFSIPNSDELRAGISGSVARLWAEDETGVSRSRGLRLDSESGVRANLVLVERLKLSVRVSQTTGGAVRGASVLVDLTDVAAAHHDPIGATYGVNGLTDSDGAFLTEVLPDSEFDMFKVRVEFGKAVVSYGRDELRQVRGENELRLHVEFPPTAIVRGRVLEATGGLAKDVFVAVVRQSQPLPSVEGYVSVGVDGRFGFESVVAAGARVVVVANVARVAGRRGFVPRVLHHVELRATDHGAYDVGDLVLPRRRSIAVTVSDRDGRPVMGSVGLWRPDLELGVSYLELGRNGRIVLEGVPSGVKHVLSLELQHDEYGKLEIRQELSETENEKSVTVTGAGLVVVRLRDASGGPAIAVDPSVAWGGASAGSILFPGARSEMRVWIEPNSVVSLSIGTLGTTTAVRRVRIRSDGPTFVDVQAR